MTSEQRLDRLERVAKLFVRAGLRARRNMKAQDEKINIIINNQIEHDDRFARMSRSMEQTQSELTQSIERTSYELSQAIGRSNNELSQSIGQTRNELSESLNELAKAQIHTSGRLDALIEIVRRDRNGSSN
jgi:DNA anti-recombination protein RmuC